MSRRRNRGKAITPSAVARQGGRVTDRSADVVAMTSNVGQVPPMARLMPSPPAWASMVFGPGSPLDPVPINPVRPDSGRPEPRLYEFPVSWNLSTSSQRLVPWSILRNAADGVSMFRRCIQVRKDHMTGLDWDIVIGDDALDAAQRKADRAERAAKKAAGKAPVSPVDQATTSPTPPAGPVGAGEAGPIGAVPPTAKPTSVSSSSTVMPPTTAAPAGQGDGATPPAEDTPATGRAAVEDEMRERLAPAIDAAKKFMRVPDRGNGKNFETWLGALLEEVFVLDALAIYPRRTNGGDLWSLEIVDGSTIKPLLDDRGGRPLPPFPAFQQVLYGFPRGDFTAAVSETDGPNGPDLEYDGSVYPSDQLIYAKRVDRVWSPYGLSAVEQALDDGALFLKRHLWMMSEYTDGTSVAGLFTTAEATNWSPEQLLEFEVAFNRLYQGSSTERHAARFLPPGVLPIDQGGSIGSDAIAERYKPEYDMYLLKLMVSHFDTTLPEIGFTDAGGGGLGSEGYHEGQAAVQQRKRLPVIKFVESLITAILHDHFGSPDEIEFRFLGLDDEDEPSAAELDMKRQEAGITTLNEERDRIGLARYAFPEADMPYVSTGRGLVFLEGASIVAQPVPAGYLEGPPMPPKPGDASSAPAGGSSPPAPGTGKPVAPPAGAPAQPTPAVVTPTAVAKAAELVAYRRWLNKGAAGGRRPFRWEHHTEAEAGAIVKAGGDPGPKAPWPGWSRDLTVMDHYAPALSRALTGAVGAQTLATRWSEHGGTVDVGVARAWLGHDLAGRITAALTPVLHRVWTEGWLIGDVSAGFMLDRLGPHPEVAKALGKSVEGEFNHATDWGNWTPGDARAAKAIIEGSGRYPGLAALIESGDVTIASIAAHRVDELAKILSQAAGEGWSNGRTAAAIRGLLTDPRWAKMVAITEVSRASSASSLSRYRDHGVDAKSWMTAADQRVCPECHEDEAQGDIPVSDYFQDGSDAPPGHPTCLPGDALVSARSRITGATKRMYHGELVEIRTLGEKLLTGTPNHPVLTDHGWVPLGQLGEGQYVLSSLGREWSDGVDQDNHDVPARIEDVAEAFLRASQVATTEVPVSAEDFHGDGAGSEVAVVGSDRGLLVPSGQPAGQQILQSGDVDAATVQRLGGSHLALERHGYTTVGLVGSGSEFEAFLGRCARHALDHGRTSAARLDARLQQNATDGSTGDGVELAERLLANPGEVALDQVILVRRFPFADHVYNLQTDDGWYIGNGVIVHNCRCAIAPGWLPEGAATGGESGGGLDLGDLVGLSEEDAGLGLSDALEAEEEIEAEEVDEWAAEVEAILSSVEEGLTEGPDLGGSTGANVHRVETADGRVLVSKTPIDPYPGADETEGAAYQRDAEVLGSQVVRAVGLDAPTVAQRGDELLMSFMEGESPELYTSASEFAAIDYGPEADRVRLADLLMSNNDRNYGNLVVREDGSLGLFDHGLAFQPWSEPEVVPTWRLDRLRSFAEGGSWTTNPLTAQDVATLRGRLRALEGAFRERGRLDWYEKMTTRLDVLGRHASGTVDLIL